MPEDITVPAQELIEVGQLKADPSNPNVMDDKKFTALKEVIKKFGFIVPIITNKKLKIADGYHRMKAAQDLGMTKVPVIRLNVKEVDRRILRQIMNKLKGEHDKEKDQLDFYFLDQEDSVDRLISMLPNEESNIRKLLRSLQDEQLGKEDETVKVDSYERAKKKTKVKRGDVYLLGPHRLMCGDSTSPGEVNKLFGNAKPILMVTDPPYGVNYDPKWRDEADKKGKLGNNYPTRSLGAVKNDDRIDWSEAYDLFPGDIVYIWHAGKYTSQVQQSMESSGFDVISQLIWAKPHFILSRGDYHWQHEPCLYGVKKGKKHNWQRSRNETTIWNIKGMNCFGGSKEEGDAITGHGTQKPLECMRKPILNNTRKGQGVYDPFCGSGTTIIAADQTERICYAMEFDSAYVQIILDRWEKHKGEKAKKETN